MHDRARRALDYPYRRLPGSWVLRGGAGHRRAEPLDLVDAGGPLDGSLVEGRVAVLAIGSNAAPAQLARKFPDASWGDVPVLAVTLHHHDVVYAARVSEYGAVPATLHPSPGTAAAVHVTLLTDRQLARMDETEGLGVAYERCEVAAELVRLRHHAPGAEAPSVEGPVVERPTVEGPVVEGPAVEGPVVVYQAVAGAVAIDGSACALAAVAAAGRRLASRTQPEVLAWLAADLGRPVDELVSSLTAADGRAARDEARRHLSARVADARVADGPVVDGQGW